MTARTGMVDLIQELRAMTQVGSVDYQAGTVYYFSDDQLQAELDKTQVYWRSQMLHALGIVVGAGTPIYRDYQFPEPIGPWLEGTVGGTVVWRVLDYAGNLIAAANYSVNMQARRITFNANQLGSATYLDCMEYNLNRAAANIWRWKASHVAQAVDWSISNASVKASQKRQQAMEMARYYSSLAGLQAIYLVRGDEN